MSTTIVYFFTRISSSYTLIDSSLSEFDFICQEKTFLTVKRTNKEAAPRSLWQVNGRLI